MTTSDHRPDAPFVARGVTKRFGRGRRNPTVLDRLDLTLEPGHVTVLLGRNGAGKTTLMRAAVGLLAPDAGTIRIAGFDASRQPDAVRVRVGYVPDTPDAPGWMKLGDLLRFFAPHYSGRWRHDLAAQLADRFAIPGNTRLRDMSRGEGMKTMLLLALAPDPEILLLDEPFAGLDPVVRDDVLTAVVTALEDGARRTVLCATHELDIAARLADRVALLDDGRIVRHAPLDAIVAEARTPQPGGASLADALRDALIRTNRPHAARTSEAVPCRA